MRDMTRAFTVVRGTTLLTIVLFLLVGCSSELPPIEVAGATTTTYSESVCYPEGFNKTQSFFDSGGVFSYTNEEGLDRDVTIYDNSIDGNSTLGILDTLSTNRGIGILDVEFSGWQGSKVFEKNTTDSLTINSTSAGLEDYTYTVITTDSSFNVDTKIGINVTLGVFSGDYCGIYRNIGSTSGFAMEEPFKVVSTQLISDTLLICSRYKDAGFADCSTSEMAFDPGNDGTYEVFLPTHNCSQSGGYISICGIETDLKIDLDTSPINTFDINVNGTLSNDVLLCGEVNNSGIDNCSEGNFNLGYDTNNDGDYETIYSSYSCEDNGDISRVCGYVDDFYTSEIPPFCNFTANVTVLNSTEVILR